MESTKTAKRCSDQHFRKVQHFFQHRLKPSFKEKHHLIRKIEMRWFCFTYNQTTHHRHIGYTDSINAPSKAKTTVWAMG
jgi:hypothetical protein